MELKSSDFLKTLFTRKNDVYESIKESIEDKGFLDTHPIIAAEGPWTDTPVVIDGYTRWDAAKELGVEPEVGVRYCQTEEEAIQLAIFFQVSRRNLTDADILACVEKLDSRNKAGRPSKKLSSSDDNFETDDSSDRTTSESIPPDENKKKKGKSSESTAKMLGTSATKVERIRAILSEDAPKEIKEKVLGGKKSINSAYNDLKSLRVKSKKSFKKAQTSPKDDSGKANDSSAKGVDVIPIDEVRVTNSDSKTSTDDSSNEFLDSVAQVIPSRDSDDSLEGLVIRIQSLPDKARDEVIVKINEILAEYEKTNGSESFQKVA